MTTNFSEPAKETATVDLSFTKPPIIEPLKEFLHLQRFPFELQAKIWNLIIPLTLVARLVSIIPKVKGNQLPSGLLHLCSVARTEYRKHYERIVSKSPGFAFFYNYELDTLDINRK